LLGAKSSASGRRAIIRSRFGAKRPPIFGSLSASGGKRGVIVRRNDALSRAQGEGDFGQMRRARDDALGDGRLFRVGREGRREGQRRQKQDGEEASFFHRESSLAWRARGFKLRA
jgi:hypothetical protein